MTDTKEVVNELIELSLQLDHMARLVYQADLEPGLLDELDAAVAAFSESQMEVVVQLLTWRSERG